MLIKTRYFGEIDVDDTKILTFDDGLIGFENLKKFTLIYNNETEASSNVTWLQSLDEPVFALPVMNPLLVKEDYNPMVEDELLKPLGDISGDELLVLTTVTVPPQIENMTTNLKAPFIINAENFRACQIILEDDKYLIKYPIYEILKGSKEE